ncbi:MAG: hypothetical protein M1825_002080 [Sarcosagium campestre]|nr:MAG: hypothetical protein M1825_002080 [Sarcosagium campestre]
MFAATTYLVRGSQLFFGISKRAVTERAEEMGNEADEIPLTRLENTDALPYAPSLSSPPPSHIPSAARQEEDVSPNPIPSHSTTPMTILRQDPVPLTRPQRWASRINARLKLLAYMALFMLIGLPLYYSTGYAMPAQLCLSILTYFAALSLPARSLRILHPVLVSSALSILGIWVLALTRKLTLREGLATYVTKTRYLQLWRPGHGELPLPGAGDVFSSILDASIVALALPMFQYRHELKRHLLVIAVPTILLATFSLFGYPAVCAAIGLAPARSLAFAARSLTLALATPAATNLGGDLSLVAVLCIMSGILGVLIGPLLLKWMRIPEDDYVTRGVALGGNSSAIATALLLASDPRAAALSSLSMSMLGTLMVALTSVPPVVRVVDGIAGLSKI